VSPPRPVHALAPAVPRLLGLVLGLLLLSLPAGFAAPAGAEVLREETVETYALAPGARLRIQNTNGSLEFTSWDRDEVRLEVTKVVKTLGHSRARRALDDLRIEVTQSPDALEVETRNPGLRGGIVAWLSGGPVQARVTYRVTVPRDVRVEATTVNGDVVMDTVRGSITARTTNGQIHLVGAAGVAKASTTNGNIRAEFVAIADPSELVLRTTNGGIVVYVPGTIRADIDASTVNGAVNTDFAVLTDSSSAWRRKSLRGALNGGGGQLRLETVNGSIQLRKIADG